MAPTASDHNQPPGNLTAAPSVKAAALDLTRGLTGAPPLWLLPDGTFTTTATQPVSGMAALNALVNAARWISSRRGVTFERLFAPDPLHPEAPPRPERLSVDQARHMLTQAQGAIATATPGGPDAKRVPDDAVELRSAALTVLSHLVATVLKDPSFRPIADAATASIFKLITDEHGDTARPALRAHAILLLQLRGPAIAASDRARATTLLQSLVRAAPPYADFKGPLYFAMCSDSEFHDGELQRPHEPPQVQGGPPPRRRPQNPALHRCLPRLRSPLRGPHRPAPPHPRAQRQPRRRKPGNEPALLHRHAHQPPRPARLLRHARHHRHHAPGRLQAHDEQPVRRPHHPLRHRAHVPPTPTSTRRGTPPTSAPIPRPPRSTLPRASTASSPSSKASATRRRTRSSKRASARRSGRTIRITPWPSTRSSSAPPTRWSSPATTDLNGDGHAALYDGFFDFRLKSIAQDLRASLTPRDPGVAASQIGGEAARGLDWAAGSLNRCTQYSEFWAALPGESEKLYAFQSGGFYSHREPPGDVPLGNVKGKPVEDSRTPSPPCAATAATPPPPAASPSTS